MSETQQSSFTIMTLAEWMTQHHDELDEIVAALCQIFDLPDADLVTTYVEMEIDNQARLLLVVDEEMVLAVAGWNWAHLDHEATELPVYLGVRRNLDVEGLRATLVTSVLNRLRQDRELTKRDDVTMALLQYHPGDRDLRDLCELLGCTRDRRRNNSFKATLGATGALRSMTASIT